jgi:hypothetical protein
MIFIVLSLVFTRANTFKTALHIFTGIFTWQEGIVHPYIWVFISFAALIIATLCAFVKSGKTKIAGKKKQIDAYYPLLDLSKFWHLVLFFLIILLLAGLAYSGFYPFVYFQF